MRINDLAAGFVDKGHEVTVLTGTPNYPEGVIYAEFTKGPCRFNSYKGTTIIRVPMIARGKKRWTLALNYASFFLSAAMLGPIKLKGMKYDAIFVYAVSPIMAAIPAIVLGKLKKTPVYLWILDLWPDTLKALGVVKNERLLALVGGVVSWIYNRADYLLLQSEGFREIVFNYCTKEIAQSRVVYFPSWAEDLFCSKDRETLIDESKMNTVFTITFAGNIGEAQDFPTILDAIESVGTEMRVRFVIVGDGRAAGWVREQIDLRRLENIILLGRLPLEEMPTILEKADALLVSLKSDQVFSRTIPGKVQAYLASRRPIIAMANGETARIIKESGAGTACAAGDSHGLSAAFRSMVNTTPAQRFEMGECGRAYYEKHFSKTVLFDKLENLFRSGCLRSSDY